VIRFGYVFNKLLYLLNKKLEIMTTIEFNNQILSYENNLRKFAYSLTSNFDDSYDLVQETYLKAFSYKDRLSDYSNLKSWMLSIMKNTFINNYHKASRKYSAMDSDAQQQIMSRSNDEGKLGPEAIYTECEILAAVEGLSPEYRDPFKMHLKGYKYKEIAEEMELNIGTVKSRIFNARQILMDVLKDLSN